MIVMITVIVIIVIITTRWNYVIVCYAVSCYVILYYITVAPEGHPAGALALAGANNNINISTHDNKHQS